MATEFKRLAESGKLDNHLLEDWNTQNVSIYVKDGIDAREYAYSLEKEGTATEPYEIKGNIIRTHVPLIYIPLLAQRDEIEKINVTFYEVNPLTPCPSKTKKT